MGDFISNVGDFVSDFQHFRVGGWRLSRPNQYQWDFGSTKLRFSLDKLNLSGFRVSLRFTF